MKVIDTRFWISVILITVIGTLGSVLFKHGTNAFGTLTIERLLHFQISKTSLVGLTVLSAGLATSFVGGYLLRDASFAVKFLFYPTVFLALIMLFISRFLIGIPLSVTGLGRLNALLTVTSIISTAVASALAFRETFSMKVIIGFLLGVASIMLIGEA